MSTEGFLIPNGTDPAAAPETSPPELTRWEKFRLVVKVVELRLRFIALMAATGLVFAYWDTLWNYYDKWTRPVGEHVAAASDIEYYCPMHPNIMSTFPATWPYCGMALQLKSNGVGRREHPARPVQPASQIPFQPTNHQAGERHGRSDARLSGPLSRETLQCTRATSTSTGHHYTAARWR